jgi:hypothetical protein
MGLALVAVGIEHTIDEASHHVLSFGARWALCGGVALYLLSISVIWVTARRSQLFLADGCFSGDRSYISHIRWIATTVSVRGAFICDACWKSQH